MIKTEHLTHAYGVGTPFEVTAIEDVNVHIEKGDYVGVIGHTGSGKSTLMKLIAKELGVRREVIFAFSSENGFGKDKLLDYIEGVVE